MGEARPKDIVGAGSRQPRNDRCRFAIPRSPTFRLNGKGADGKMAVTQTISRFLLKLFQRRSCRSETTKLVCARLTPYFSITHPTRGTLPGPFFKLPTAHRRLILDVVVTMLDDRDVRAAAGEFLSTVERSLIGQEEKEYWDQISRRLYRSNLR